VAADACGLTGRKGRLLPGHDADVLAVEGDPTVRPSALLDVRAVFRAGRRVV
jgi:imidazolonepropionase-like amidohydrolase